MVDLTNIPTDGRGVARSLLQTVAGWLPWGLGALGLTYLFGQAGGEDSFMSRLEQLPVIGSLFSAFGRIVDAGRTALRRITNREGYEADQGIRTRINNNRVFEEAAREVGGTADEQRAFAESLREIVRDKSTSDTGDNVTERSATDDAIALRTAIHDRIVEEQNRRNPTLPRDPNNSQRAPLEDMAVRYAVAISGADNTEAAYINPNTAGGYLGLLYQTMQSVAAEGQFQQSQVGQFRVELAPATPTSAPATPPVPAGSRQPTPQAGV